MCWRGQKRKKEERKGKKEKERGSAIQRNENSLACKYKCFQKKAVFPDSHRYPSECWKHLLFDSEYYLKEVAVVIRRAATNVEFNLM